MTAQQHYAIGIDFGGTKMLGAAVTPDGTVLHELREATPLDADGLFAAITKMVLQLESASGLNAVGIGIGAAGLVDRNGFYHFGPNVGGVRALDVGGELQRRLGSERVIEVDNDNTCAAWGECMFGAGRGIEELIFIGLGTGIGGGLVSAGRLHRGRNGFSAEVGHMTIETDGQPCECGKRGCWEAYASGRALGRLGRDAAMSGQGGLTLSLAGGNIDALRGEHVTRAARQGDAEAKLTIDRFSRWLAIGIANLIAVFDPQVVIIGGGMSEEADLFLEQTQMNLTEHVFGYESRPEVPLIVAQLGSRAGAIGAAMLAHGRSMPVL